MTLRDMVPLMNDEERQHLAALVNNWRELRTQIASRAPNITKLVDELLDLEPVLQSPRSSLNFNTSMARPGARK